MRGFLGGASGKEPAGDVRDAVSIPGLRKSLSGGHGNPLLYSCLENPLGKEACQATVQRVAHNWSDLACMFVLNSEKREIWIKYLLWPSLVARRIKNLPAVQETWVQSLGWEDPLKKGMTTHSSMLDWRIPWTEQPVGLQSTVSHVVHDWVTNSTTIVCWLFSFSWIVWETRAWSLGWEALLEKGMASHSSILA